MDFTARLRIGTTRRIPAIAVPTSIAVAVPIAIVVSVPVMIAIATVHAAKLSIDIFNRGTTAREGLQRSVTPVSISILAARTQNTVANPHIFASLSVTAGWQRAILFANQPAVIVGDIVPAAVRAIQHSIVVATTIVLAARAQVIASHINVFATLLVGSPGIVIHCHGA